MVTELSQVMPIPAGLQAPGTKDAAFSPVMRVSELGPGAMQRVSAGDLDVLILRTSCGLIAIDDRCPHMAAPLSVGRLEGCEVQCPLHQGRFDLVSGDTVRFPTTGGLDADGGYHATWSPPGGPPKPEPSDDKARARALTRVRRLRYYRLRVQGDHIEVAIPG